MQPNKTPASAAATGSQLNAISNKATGPLRSRFQEVKTSVSLSANTPPAGCGYPNIISPGKGGQEAASEKREAPSAQRNNRLEPGGAAAAVQQLLPENAADQLDGHSASIPEALTPEQMRRRLAELQYKLREQAIELKSSEASQQSMRGRHPFLQAPSSDCVCPLNPAVYCEPTVPLNPRKPSLAA